MPETFVQFWRFLRSVFRAILENAEAWCKDRVWYVRILFVPYFIYISYRYLTTPIGPDIYTSWFSALNLGIHEGGHMLAVFCQQFGRLGEMFYFFAGSLAQCLAP